MQKNEYALLYFHEDKVGLSLCKTSETCGAVHIISRQETSFSGFLDGELPEYTELVPIVQSLATAVFRGVRSRVPLYVQAPDLFCRTIAVDLHESLPVKKIIGDRELASLLEKGFDRPSGFSIIHRSVLYYNLDGGPPIAKAEGANAKNISVNLGITFCDERFISLMHSVVAGTQFTKTLFVPTSLALANYLIPQELRDSGTMLLSCDMFSTTLSTVYGDGIAESVTTPFGCAHVIGDLCIVLDIDHVEAEEILSQVVLSYHGDTEKIVLATNVIKSRLDEIAEQFEHSLGDGPNQVMHMAGKGIVKITRVRDYLTKKLGVYVAKTNCPQTGECGSVDTLVRALVKLATRV